MGTPATNTPTPDEAWEAYKAACLAQPPLPAPNRKTLNGLLDAYHALLEDMECGDCHADYDREVHGYEHHSGEERPLIQEYVEYEKAREVVAQAVDLCADGGAISVQWLDKQEQGPWLDAIRALAPVRSGERRHMVRGDQIMAGIMEVCDYYDAPITWEATGEPNRDGISPGVATIDGGQVECSSSPGDIQRKIMPTLVEHMQDMGVDVDERIIHDARAACYLIPRRVDVAGEAGETSYPEMVTSSHYGYRCEEFRIPVEGADGAVHMQRVRYVWMLAD